MNETYLAQDALRFAVDLHAQRYRYQDPDSDKVMADAEMFYQWLKEKTEEQR